jgi:hypothetical protein
MRMVSIITLVVLLFLFVAGCSDKKNVIGDDSNLHPYYTEIKADSLFQYFYSYENETGSFIRNDKSLTGHFRTNESITLLRFTNLPDSGFVFTEETAPSLILPVKKHFNSEGMVLRIGIIKQFWHHFFATWENAEEDVEWEKSWDDYSAMTLLEGIEEYIVSEEDSTVVFTLPKEVLEGIIEGWTMEDPEGYGFAVYAEDGGVADSYLEFYSRETSDGPLLSFDYYATEGDTAAVSYERMPVHQTFINSKQPVEGYYTGEELQIANIVPTRTAIKLNLFDEFFVSLSPEEDLKKITINKAELVLYKEQEEGTSHFGESRFEIFPYIIVNNEYPLEEADNLPIPVEDLQSISPTFTSVITETQDSLAVNITSIVQSHISELKPNLGFIITSSLENKDNSFIGFYPPGHLEEEKRPYLRILYTLPFIPE